MKHLCAAFLLAVSLLLSGQVLAAPQVFDSPAGKFSIDVPDGWKAKPVDMGCQLMDAKEENSLSLQYKKADGMDAKTFIQALAKGMNAKILEQDVDKDGTATMTCEIDGQKIYVVVTPVGDILTIAVMGGKELQKMGEILGTVKSAN